MIERDTIKLLRECDSGVKMGIGSIKDVLDYVKSDELKSVLNECRKEHESLDVQIQEKLCMYNDDGKDPNPIAKSMSWIKTELKLGLNDSDKTVADLITDGCNMGVKSLSKYLNQYEAADEFSKDVAKKLINSEEKLSINIRKYLWF